MPTQTHASRPPAHKTRPGFPSQQRDARPPDQTNSEPPSLPVAEHRHTPDGKQRDLSTQPTAKPVASQTNPANHAQRTPVISTQTPDQSKHERPPQKYSDSPPYIAALRKIYRATPQRVPQISHSAAILMAV